MEWRTFVVCILLLALTSIQVDSKNVYPSNHVNSVCSMWGNFHFKTFDGDVYQFPGMCEYNLVSECQSLIRQFSVYVKRTENTNSPKISRVSVSINDIAVELTEKQVVVNGEKVTLPVYISGILVEENTIYTRLYSKMGITVTWNKDDAVMVELDSKYSNRTCGLCGDFNGVPVYSEFIEYGRRVGYTEFGNKHRVPNPTHACEDPFENIDEENVVDQCEKYRADCADLLKDENWSSCSWVLNPEPYIKACTNDICSRQPEDEDKEITALCATLSEYSRQCSHAGGIPPTWRTANFCAVTCPYNMVHSESGSPCMDTCSHKDTNKLCEEHYIDGCFCPPGTVFDDISNTGCIPPEKCQCKHDRAYSTGEVLRKDEEECTCEEGKWICMSIPGPGLCAVEEGSHFTTYDGKEFTFHGDCNYVLSKDCEDSKFIILGQIVPCFTHETDTCLKSIVVLFDNDKKNPLIIKADGMVQQHNAEVSLPYMTADFTVFRPSSFHIILQATFGLQVQVQLVPLMQVYITVDKSFQGKTCGLCGNFNKVLCDDLTTPQGVVEGAAVSFANAWKAQTNCPDRSERMDDPCSYSSDSEHFAEHWCSKMKDKESLFAKCHASVNPDSFYKRCKYSSCTCEKSEDCLCTVFSSYARACAAKGVFLQGWREIVCEKYKENCPASQNYSYQLQSCQRTCLSLASERQSCDVNFVPVDGCACPDGLYQDENGLCVPMDKCPCYHNGQKIHPGKSVNIRNEHCVCMNGKFQCRSWKTQNLECSSPKVFFNCSTAGPDEHGLECTKTCLQQEVDCFSMDCQSGCQCPFGLLDDNRGHCVKPDNCPCKHDGQFYAPGSQITAGCNTCTCRKGKWKCTHNKCPGICTIYGSGHYITFDQRRFGFNGDCSYIAAQNKCGNKTGNFHVITENMPCGTTGTTCSKAVGILLGRTWLLLSDGTVMATDTGSGPKIKYNERNVGMYLVIDAEIGLTILWDRKTTVRIILQPQHMGDVCGLCGNFNGDGKDDFTTQGNLPTTNEMEFVDSWKVSSTCPDAKPDFNPCLETPNRETWSKIQCSIIKEVTFKDCHNKVDPNPYYDNCVKDSCACDAGGDCECFCTAVAAYAQACNEAGVCVVWRTPEICPVYCDFYNEPGECTWHYSPCHTPCYKTCLNPEGICNNTLPNLEGCYPECPEDKPIYDEKNEICVEICTTPEPSTSTSEPTPTFTPTPTTTTMSTTTPEPTTSSTPTVTTTTKLTTTTPEPTTSSTPTPTTTTESPTTTPEPTTSSTPTPTTTTESPTTTPEPTSSSTPTPTTTTESPTTTPPEPTTSSTPTVTTTTKSITTTPEPTTSSTPTPTTTTESPTTTPEPTTSSTTTVTTTTTTTEPTTSSTPTPTTTTESPTTTPEPTTSSTPTPTTTTKSPTTTPEPTTSSTPTPPTFSSTTVETSTECLICNWTEWFNVYNPALGGGNDLETYENIAKSGKEICEQPEDIECRGVAEPEMSFEDYIHGTKQVAQCNVSNGLVCWQNQQTFRPKKCFDYEIRVYCCFICSTPSTSTTTTSTITTTPTTAEPTTSSSPTPTTTTKSPTTTPGPTTSTKVPTTSSTTTPTTTTESPTTTAEPTTSSTPTPTTTTKSPTTTPELTTSSIPTPTTTTESPTTTPELTTSSTPTPTTTTKSTTTPEPTTSSTPTPTTTTESPTTTTEPTTSSTPTPTTTTESPTTTPEPTTSSTPTVTTTTKSITTTPEPTTSSTPTPTTTTESPTTTPEPTTSSSPTPTTTTKSPTTTPGLSTSSTPTPTTTTESPTTPGPSTSTPEPTTSSTTTPTTTTKSTTTPEPTTSSTPTPTTTTKSPTTTPGISTTSTPTPTTTTESPTTTPELTTSSTPTPTTTTKFSTSTPEPTTSSTPTPTTTTESPTTTTEPTTSSTPTPTTTTESPTTTPEPTTSSTPTVTTTTKSITTTPEPTTSSTPTPTTTTESPTTTPEPTTSSTPTPTTTTKSPTTTPGLSTSSTPTPTTTTESPTTPGPSTSTPEPTTSSTTTPTTITKSTTTPEPTTSSTPTPTTTTKSPTTTPGISTSSTPTPTTTIESPTTTPELTTSSTPTPTTTAKFSTSTPEPTTSSTPTPTATTKSPTTTPELTTSSTPTTTTESPTTTLELTTSSTPTPTTTTKSTTTPESTTTSTPTPTTTTESPTTTPELTTSTSEPTTSSTPTPTTTTKSPTTTPELTTSSIPTPTTTTESFTTTPELTTSTSEPTTLSTTTPTTTTESPTTTPELTTSTSEPTTSSTPTPTTTTESPTTTPELTTSSTPTPTTITESPTTTPELTTSSSPTPTATTKSPTTTAELTTSTSEPTTSSTPTPTTTTESPTTTPELTTSSTPTPTTTTKPTTTPGPTTSSTPTPTTTTESPTTTPELTTSSTPTPTTTTKSPTTTPELTTSSTPTPTTTTKSTTTPGPTTSSTPTPTTTTESPTTTPELTTSTSEPTTSSTPTPTATTKSTTTPGPTTSSTPTPTTTTESPNTTPELTTSTSEPTTSSTPTPTATTKSTTTPGPTTSSTPMPTTTTESPTTTPELTTSTSEPTTSSTPTPTATTKSPTTTPGPTTSTEEPTTSSTTTPKTTTESTTTPEPSTSTPTQTTTTKSPTTTPEITTSSTTTPTTTSKSTTTPELTTSSTPTPTTTTKSTKTTPVITGQTTARKTPPTAPQVFTSSPTTPHYDCPEWDKNTNETFILCDCVMARCIEDNIIEIIPFECPPLQNITCENGKKPVLVYDEHHCCQYYQCDCFCEGWGDPHYITFDGVFYSYQGNCTYILMEEITPHYHLKIYIDNVYCDPIEHVSCPRSIIVSYNKQVITLTNHNLIGGADLEAVKDNVKLTLPFAKNGVRVISSGLDLFLSIPLLGVDITFGATGFGINLPYQHFGNNTQGHCGTCNNNRADDCMIPGGILVDDCAVMADYWPASGVNGEICTPPTALPTAGGDLKPTPKPCQAHPDCNLLSSELFQACHSHVSPENFFLGCQYDSCHMSNPAVVCTSLQSYARACSQIGVCIHWRNYTNLCNIECPEDKVFNPCGPAEPPSCDDIPERSTIKVPTEGCFCPEGTMLFNKESGVCVDKCGCLDSSGTPREFDEVFEYNCEECICDKASKSVICKPKKCSDVNPEICTEPGFVLVNVTNPSDPCCSKQVCNCDINMCPSLDKKCTVGFAPVMEVPNGKCCPQIKCEPKKVCVHKNKEYEPGTDIPVVNCQECSCTWDVDPKTQWYKIKCAFVQCDEKCDPGYEYIDTNLDECCGKCVQTHCIINVNGVNHILQEGDTLPTTNQGCDKITCTKVNGQFVTDKYTVQCPPFNVSNCQPGTVQLSADGCCRVCVDQIKGCQVKTVRDYINHNDCQSEKKMDLTFCAGDCTSFSRYTDPGLSSCSCCQATRSSNRTVNLGCVNGDIVTHSYIHVEECSCSRTNCHASNMLPEISERKRSFGLP